MCLKVMRQGGKGNVEFEKGFSTCWKLHKQVNIKAKYLESGPINANTDFMFYFCTIGKPVNTLHIAKWQIFICSFLPSHSDIICQNLNTSLLSHFRNRSKVRVFTKSPYFRFSPGSYSPLSTLEILPASKKPHYFYLATDISFITLIAFLSFEQRGWCGLYYITANS